MPLSQKTPATLSLSHHNCRHKYCSNRRHHTIVFSNIWKNGNAVHLKTRNHQGHIIESDVARVVGGIVRQKQPVDGPSEAELPDHPVESELNPELKLTTHPEFATLGGPIIPESTKPTPNFPLSRAVV
ncbi:hypothetical protein GOBAR_AA00054 [Gossypium barbadense]|uniref:Uncharacterized protein n=1 Tax=Gossypium barbadense TaxID=3634 RepID=A0A2P5YY67_GOSBA|nr:hypothetical protein GOBAR_AA00054 [Gossypium barbadense]